MIGGQDIRKGKEWFVKLKQVEVYLPEKQISLLAFSKIQTKTLLERKRQENEGLVQSAPCLRRSLLSNQCRFSKEETKEKRAVRTRMNVASENEDSRSGDIFWWVILLALSLIWVYSIKRMQCVCVRMHVCMQVCTSASFFSVSFSWYLHPRWCWLFSSHRAKIWLQTGY